MLSILINAFHRSTKSIDMSISSLFRFLNFDIIGVAFFVFVIINAHFEREGPYWFAGSLSIIAASTISAFLRPLPGERYYSIGERKLEKILRFIMIRAKGEIVPIDIRHKVHSIWFLFSIILLYISLALCSRRGTDSYANLCWIDDKGITYCALGICSLISFSVGIGGFVATLQTLLIRRISEEYSEYKKSKQESTTEPDRPTTGDTALASGGGDNA